ARSHVSVITIHAPASAAINTFLNQQRDLPLTYEETAMSRGTAPAGFNRDHRRERLGSGIDAFERAVAALRAWTMFKQGWLEVYPGDAPYVGQVVAIVIRTGPLCWTNACRVLYLIDDSGPVRRVGFAYGTLPGHAECGEERFTVEMTPDG